MLRTASQKWLTRFTFTKFLEAVCASAKMPTRKTHIRWYDKADAAFVAPATTIFTTTATVAAITTASSATT